MIYFVATPIGNLSEITYRAVETLNNVDYIFCEDTRHSQTLLNHYNINKKLYSYHKFNEKQSLDFIASLASDGKDIAIISDAGMPAINDPGNILVNFLIQNNLEYTVISGASAFVNAFVLSGYQPPFTFVGFLPEKSKDREKLLSQLNTNGVLIFYVAVHDIAETFDYLESQLGNRNCCLVRELSKMHEEVFFTKLSDAPQNNKGEFVLVVDSVATDNPLLDLSPKEHVWHYIDSGMSKTDAIKQVAKDRGVHKNEIYQQILDYEIK